jgi:hypothetical protein
MLAYMVSSMCAPLAPPTVAPMLTSAAFVIAMHAASIALVPGPTSVSNSPTDTSPLISVAQARSAFVGQAYRVDQAVVWTWTSPPVSTFRVWDSNSDRVAIVLVYPTRADADNARTSRRPLVVGYTAETWRANVVIAQTTQTELDRLQRLQEDCENGVLGDSTAAAPKEATGTSGVLDAGLLRALDLSASPV